MSTLFGVRKALLAAPLLAAFAAVAVALPSSNGPGSANIDTVVAAANLTYYNNAAHTVVVGRFGYDCCNNRVAWGKKSQFVTSGGCFPLHPAPAVV